MTSFCTSCGGELSSEAKFCASCGAAVATGCVSCGAELPDGASFCPSCGSAQDASVDSVASPEELRVISCLFADLAGFTSHTEQSDPEDVRARLAVYHREVRADVERWGGHVEKLMGDGVFAVFGVPTINEDDPERAVRAALRIQQSVEAINEADPSHDLSVRIGVTTGEAIVQLDEADQNERIIGDVVNTASRLEGIAPAGGIVVDERTYHAVRNLIEFRPLEPVEVKGKAAPLSIWQALEARSRYGVAVTEDDAAEFVGRSEEMSLLVDALERTIVRRKPQLVTISGEPGVGKSRLVRELLTAIDDRNDIVVRWRQGRCLPYGEGVTFWALSEIVKSEAGILESEPPDQARAKLRQSVDALAEGVEGVDTNWLVQRLAPLAGTGGGEGVDRAELFNAWLQYVELLAQRHPLVMLIEDLHWADDALADFLEHLIDWADDAPILLVCTARPDWFTRRPDWGGGKREAATIGLSPLTADETAQLVASLSKRAVMPAEMQQALLSRSGGNPLYLTEYVHLASEQGWFEPGKEVEDLPLPDSVQAIIAARLDLLDSEDKTLLQAASVVGRVFWAGALSFLRDADSQQVREAMSRLTRRELVRPVRRSSMQGQDEYIFNHVLARDVAYAQITKSERARLHRETARWLEAVSGDRLVDVAELLAHHLVTALDLTPTENQELLDRAYRFLMLAAERNQSLDMTAAARFAKRASDVATSDTDRAEALLEYSKSQSITRDETLSALDEAIELFSQQGNTIREAFATDIRAGMHWWVGNAAEANEGRMRALAQIEGLPPSRESAQILAGNASHAYLAGDLDMALDLVEQALAAAAASGDVSARARALRVRGQARSELSQGGAGDDVTEAMRIDMDLGNTQGVMSSYNSKATYMGYIGEARDAVDVIDEGIAYAEVRGALASAEWSKMTKCELLIQLGRIDELESLVGVLEEADKARGGSQVGAFVIFLKAQVSWARGAVDEAWALAQDSLEPAREIGDPQALMPNLATSILVASAAGQSDPLPALIDEFVEAGRAHPTHLPIVLPAAAYGMIEQGRLDELAELVELGRAFTSRWLDASREAVSGLIDEARGKPADGLEKMLPAVEIADDLGLMLHTTRLRIDAARCAYAVGNAGLGDELLAEARKDSDDLGLVIATEMIDDVAAAAAG